MLYIYNLYYIYIYTSIHGPFSITKCDYQNVSSQYHSATNTLIDPWTGHLTQLSLFQPTFWGFWAVLLWGQNLKPQTWPQFPTVPNSLPQFLRQKCLPGEFFRFNWGVKAGRSRPFQPGMFWDVYGGSLESARWSHRLVREKNLSGTLWAPGSARLDSVW